jgi:hypothetical protein
LLPKKYWVLLELSIWLRCIPTVQSPVPRSIIQLLSSRDAPPETADIPEPQLVLAANVMLEATVPSPTEPVALLAASPASKV